MKRAFVLEAGALALALLGCAVATSWLATPAGLGAFLRGAPIELTNRPVVLPAGAGSRSAVRLASPSLPHEISTLAVVLRATAGGPVRLAAVDRAGAPIWRRDLPARIQPQGSVLIARGDKLAGTAHWLLVQRGYEDVTIDGLAVHRFDPIHGVFRQLSLWTAPVLAALFLLRHRHRLAAGFRRPDGAWEVVVSGAFFALCLAVFWSGPVHQVIDYKYTTAVSHSLLRSGSVALRADFAPARGEEVAHPLLRVEQRAYHYYPAAAAVLNTPFVAAFEAIGASSVGATGRFSRDAERRILRFTSAFLAAALCVLLFHFGRLWLDPATALATAAVFAFGTQIFSTLSRPYWSHTWAVLLFTAAVYLLLRWPRMPAVVQITAATLLSWSFLCRPSMSLSIVTLGAWLVFVRRRRIPALLATGLVWLLLWVAHTRTHFGSGLPPYFDHINTGRIGDFASLADFLNGALGILVSPGRGLLLFVPITLWILFATVRHWRRLPSRHLAAAALATITAHWLLLSSSWIWFGGQSFGPRLFSDMLPWFFLLAALALAGQKARARGAGGGWTPVRLGAVAVLVAASVFINARGAYAPATWQWRSYDRPPLSTHPFFQPPAMWNWRYPQFLAGLLPPDAPPE